MGIERCLPYGTSAGIDPPPPTSAGLSIGEQIFTLSQRELPKRTVLACDKGIRDRLVFEEQDFVGVCRLSSERAASWKIAAILVPWLPPGVGRVRSAQGVRFLLLLATALRGVDGAAMIVESANASLCTNACRGKLMNIVEKTDSGAERRGQSFSYRIMRGRSLLPIRAQNIPGAGRQ